MSFGLILEVKGEQARYRMVDSIPTLFAAMGWVIDHLP